MQYDRKRDESSGGAKEGRLMIYGYEVKRLQCRKDKRFHGEMAMISYIFSVKARFAAILASSCVADWGCSCPVRGGRR